MSKRSIAVTAAMLVVGLIAGIGPAQAKNTRPAPRSDTKTFDVQTHYTEPAGSEAGAKCLGGETSTPECRVLFGGKATFTGTMWGDEDYDLSGADPTVLPTGKVTYEGTAYINGGVVGCGTGTFIIDVPEGGYVDMTTYDPLTDSAEGYNTWRLRPGSGTGELTNLVSGSGVTNWTFHPLGAAGIGYFGEGDFTGTITCEVPMDERHDEPRVAATAAAGEPTAAVLGATSEPAGELPSTGGAATAALAGVALLGAGLVGRRVSRA